MPIIGLFTLKRVFDRSAKLKAQSEKRKVKSEKRIRENTVY